jgi:hypothetical protein
MEAVGLDTRSGRFAQPPVPTGYAALWASDLASTHGEEKSLTLPGTKPW